MTKITNNFINKLKKLDNYFILREEDEYIIVGTKKTIKEHVEKHTTFSSYVVNQDKTFWIFFIVGLNEEILEIKDFKKKKLPILILPKNISNSKLDILKKIIENFIEKNI